MKIIKGKGYYPCREFNDLKEMFYQSVELFGENIAYKYRHNPKGEIMSKRYCEVEQDVCALGSAISSLGLQGSRIAIIGDNSYNWAISYFSIALGGSIAVPLDKLLPNNEVTNLLSRSQVKAIFYNAHFHKTMLKYAEENKHIEKFICINYETNEMPETNDPRFVHINQLIEKGKLLLENGYTEFTDVKIDPEKVCFLLFTSGTTSQSKCVMLCQRNICCDVKGLVTLVDICPDDTFLSVLPLHHTFENTCGLFSTFYTGMTTAYSDGLRYIAQNLIEYGVTGMIGVPMLFENIYNKVIVNVKKQKKYFAFLVTQRIIRILNGINIHAGRALFKAIRKQVGPKLRIFVSGAASLEADVAKFFEDLGVRVCQGYGLTETSPVIAGCGTKFQDFGTCGHPIPGVDVAIDSENDEPGEILVRGPIVMKGYLDDIEATNDAIDKDNWFHTGDIGMFNKRNHIVITGRLKSMIVLKNGKKVFPEEIEYFVNQIDFVKEAMVFGETIDTDEVYVCAQVVVNKDMIDEKFGEDIEPEFLSLSISTAIKEINKHLPDFKKIKYYFYSYTELTKTTTLKIKRHIAIENVMRILELCGLTIKEASGKNLDLLEETAL